MRHLFPAAVLIALSAGALAVQDEKRSFDDGRGDLSASTNFTAHFVPLKRLATFNSNGGPVTVWQNSQGLRLHANKADGSATQDKQGKYTLDQLHAKGDVVVHYDSDLSRKYQLTNGLKTTDDPGIVTDLLSESADLVQTGDDQKVTLPEPFTVSDTRPGKNKYGPTLSTSKGSGTSGVFHFLNSKEKGGKAKLQTADIQGPVHYHLIRTEIDPDTSKPQTTVYDVTGDHLTTDLTKPDEGHIVLDGHVKWNRVVGTDTMSGVANRFILTTDAEGDITDFEATNNTINGDVPPKSQP